jgi:hypothetical protein
VNSASKWALLEGSGHCLQIRKQVGPEGGTIAVSAPIIASRDTIEDSMGSRGLNDGSPAVHDSSDLHSTVFLSCSLARPPSEFPSDSPSSEFLSLQGAGPRFPRVPWPEGVGGFSCQSASSLSIFRISFICDALSNRYIQRYRFV